MSRQRYKYLVFCTSLLATTQLWAQASATGKPDAAPASDSKKTRDAGLVELGVALESARSFYQVGAYDQCTAAYLKLLTPPNLELLAESQPKALEQARVHYAACLLALGDNKRADEQLRLAMTANPLMASPDPVLFPSQVRDLFFRVKGTFLEEIRLAQDQKVREAQRLADRRERKAQRERERIAALEQLAAQESVVAKNHRWVAAIPFGVGQFQNGDSGLGALFLVTEAALFATAVVATSIELGLHSSVNGGRALKSKEPLNTNLYRARTVGVLAAASCGLIAGVGIAEAQLNFVEEIPMGVRARAHPPRALPVSELRVEPSVAFGRREAFVGVQGVF